MKYKTKISFSGSTDLGRQRSNNEDAFVVQNIWDENHILAVVIDGVGGYEGGEVAAEIAQQTIVEYLKRYPNGERLDLLKQAAVAANNAIFTERQKQGKLANMSCVLTAALVEAEKKQINMVHVGDTRLYQFCKGELRKLSHDHSLVGYREEVGDLTEEEAMRHSQRNIISRDVGSEHHETSDRDFLEAATFPLLPNSILLLCSDGLCDMITSAQMKQALQRNITLEKKVESLINAANEAGGKDNITVVLVEYQNNEPDLETEKKSVNIDIEPVIEAKKTDKIIPAKIKENNSIIKIALVAIVALLLGLAAGWFTPDKYNPTKMLIPISQDTIKYDSLSIYRVDSLVIINTADTLLIKDTISNNVKCWL